MNAQMAIFGGGIIGTSIAMHLAERGLKNVVVIERDRIGLGSTSKSVGGIRSLFHDPLEVEFSVYSREAFQQLETETSSDFGYVQCGYLLLATSQSRSDLFREMVSLARVKGVEVSELNSNDLSKMLPAIDVRDVQSAVLSPLDGYVPDPVKLVEAYAHRAQLLGVKIVQSTPIVDVERSGDAFTIKCESRVIQAEQIIVALNAYSMPILRSLGTSLPCYPYPRHVFAISPPPSYPEEALPMTIFSDHDLMLRFERNRLLAICGFRERSSADEMLIPGRLDEARRRILARVDITTRKVEAAWSGLRAVTPDRRALVGALPGVPGAWCAIGFSGHGLMHAPAVGLALAEMITGADRPTFDLAPLDPKRFLNWDGEPPIIEPTHV